MGNSISKTMRWGIIGCGNVTELKSGPPYYQVEGFSLDAVMRRDIEKAKDYAERHSVKKYYSKAEDLINDPEIDAVYIATPPDTHKLYGLMVAKAKKPCCIEKPMATTYAECVEINDAFTKAKVPLFIAYYRRTLPRFVQVKKWIDEGVIGDIRHVNWQLYKPASVIDLSKEYNWRTDSKVALGGYFDDLASHGLDLICYFLGTIKEVQGICTNQQNLYSAYDAITANWIHENGITGSGSWNFGAFGREDKVEIIGSKGEIIFSVFDEAPIQYKTAENKQELVIEHPKSVQYFHIEKMKDYFFSNQVHPSTGENGVHTSWIMDKILGRI